MLLRLFFTTFRFHCTSPVWMSVFRDSETVYVLLSIVYMRLRRRVTCLQSSWVFSWKSLDEIARVARVANLLVSLRTVAAAAASSHDDGGSRLSTHGTKTTAEPTATHTTAPQLCCFRPPISASVCMSKSTRETSTSHSKLTRNPYRQSAWISFVDGLTDVDFNFKVVFNTLDVIRTRAMDFDLNFNVNINIYPVDFVYTSAWISWISTFSAPPLPHYSFIYLFIITPKG